MQQTKTPKRDDKLTEKKERYKNFNDKVNTNTSRKQNNDVRNILLLTITMYFSDIAIKNS